MEPHIDNNSHRCRYNYRPRIYNRMILTIPIFTVINIVLGFIDSRLIGKRRKILHGINGLIYLSMVVTPVLIFHNYWLIGSLLFDRLLFFNIPLSLFRGKEWNYISPAPKAITDRLAKAVFGNRGTLMYGVYLVLFIITIYLCIKQPFSLSLSD